MNIAIIGSSGYIGSYLYTNLKNAKIVGYDILKTPYSNFVVDGKDVDPSPYDVIIYLAGLTSKPICKNTEMSIVQEKNVDDLMVLANKMNSSQLLIYASTAGVMEGYVLEEGTEESIVNENLLEPYSLSLYNRENKIKTITNTNTVGVRFGTVIGISPIQRYDCHVAMIKSAILNGEATVQYPECKRTVLWNRDLLRAIDIIVKCKSKFIGHYIYNLGSFNATIQSIADDIYNYTKIGYNVSIPGGNGIGYYMSNKLFCRDFNFVFEGTSEIIIKELKENIGYLCIDNGCFETACRICKSSNLSTVLDLGSQPLANNYLRFPQTQCTYPLCIIRCEECNHTQLNYTVPPSVLFRNYQYESGTSYTLREYFLTLANKCVSESGKTTGKILELACNDGSQLDEFKKHGWETYGVDPAINLAKPAGERGHNITCGFWGKDNIELPKMDIVVAQNVLAHVPDPVMFLSTCTKVMDEDTLLYIQTSQCNMYVNGEFDTTYHEHLSYFTVSSMMKCAELSGLCIINVEKPSIHGTSYLFTMKLKTEKHPKHSDKVIEEYNKELELGLYSNTFYAEYNKKVETVKSWVNEKTQFCKDNNVKIIAYGAAAKGMTLLNYCNVTDVSYIVDDSALKHYKYTPGTNLEILPAEELKKEKGDICLFVLAWNFLDEIMNKIRSMLLNTEVRKIHIISTFPTTNFYTIYNDSHIKSTLISHVYNEEYLIPFWLNHHKGMFDKLIIINHRCTDNTLEICKEIWSDCEIIQSATTCFDAKHTDDEVMEIERNNPGIKIALNTTEFLLFNEHPFNKELSKHKIKELFSDSTKDSKCYAIRVLSPYSKNNYEVSTNLELFSNLLNTDFMYHHDRYIRLLHSYEDGSYHLGRHNSNHPLINNSDLTILWFGFYPMNDNLLKRKLQIGPWLSQHDVSTGAGGQHLYKKEDMLRIQREKSSSGSSLKTLNSSLYNSLQELNFH